jgi:hypothetical protein
MANIIQGWKGLHGKSVGLLLTAVNYDRKKFYDIGPGVKVIRLFFFVINAHDKYATSFVPGKFSSLV